MSLAVGARVRFFLGSREVFGEVVEDRGAIGVRGRRLYGVSFGDGEDFRGYVELPAEDLMVIT